MLVRDDPSDLIIIFNETVPVVTREQAAADRALFDRCKRLLGATMVAGALLLSASTAPTKASLPRPPEQPRLV
jgi:hypothetical protein